MNYTLEQKIKINPFYKGITIVIALCLFFLLGVLKNPQLDEIGFKTEIAIFIILMHLMIIFLLFVTNRRFLNKIEFDLNTGIMKTKSIIKSVRKEYRTEEIKEIKLINSKGFGNIDNGFRNQNLVIKTNGNIQPQIFEIKNEDLRKKAEEIIKKINDR